MRSIISLLMENEAGALSRVVGLFAQRGYNIESLTASPTDDATLSRLNITTHIDNAEDREQLEKQLHKLIDVIKVSHISAFSHVERELALVKIKASRAEVRDEIKRCADIFRGQIVDISATTYCVQLVGSSEKIDAFIMSIKVHADIIEVARSGVVGLARGERALRL